MGFNKFINASSLETRCYSSTSEARSSGPGLHNRASGWRRLRADQCQLAKIMALEGKSEAGRAIVEKIIKEENPDNGMLFAYAYNTLGTCHVQSQQPKPAAIAFLHTELLYGTESDPHAEALYNLAKLWPQLEETDRANRARQALKSRYRNTYWALQL